MNTCSTSLPIFAGSGEKGYMDGVAIKAKFNGIAGLAIDDKGNMFVADNENYKIRKITPDGIVSTFAGSTKGYADGKGNEAKFNALRGIAIDNKDNLYIIDSDTYKNMIRKITPDGIVSTFAGSTTVGLEDGIGTNAKFSSISGITRDKNNNIFVTDNNLLRKITSDGVVSTIKLKENSKYYLDTPTAIALDSKNNIYIIDQNGPLNILYKITSDGTISELINSLFAEDIVIGNKDNFYISTHTSPEICNGVVGCQSPDLSAILKVSNNGNILSSILETKLRLGNLTIDNKNNILYFSDLNNIYKVTLSKQ
jgi:hypothetical protein